MKLKITVLCTIIFLFVNALSGTESKDIALILKAKGPVNVKSGSPLKWQKSHAGMGLNSGDIVKTGDAALAAIMFTDDKSMIKVRDNSSLAIRGKRTENSIAKKIKFALGSLWVKVQKQNSQFLIETPSGVAAVKGTEFYCLVDQNGNSTIMCIEGLISLVNKLGKVLINAGETGESSKGQAPKVYKTNDSQIPDWGGDDEGKGNQLEFDFQDSEGNKKVLKLNY